LQTQPNQIGVGIGKKYVKTDNNTFKLANGYKLFHDGVDQCTPEMWKNFTRHTQKEEERFWNIDFIMEDVLRSMGSNIMTITGDTSDSN